MHSWLRHLIICSDREALMKTMPACFQASFGKKMLLSFLIILKSFLKDLQISMLVLIHGHCTSTTTSLKFWGGRV